MRSNRWFPTLIISSVFGTVAFFWFTQIPLGVPGEWVWNRIAVKPSERLDFSLGIFQTSVVAAVCLWFIFFGAKRISQSNKKGIALWLAGLVAAGFLWLWSVQNLPPSGKPNVKPSWVLFSPASSGYFFDAAYEIDDLSKYFANYESLMEEGDVLHKGTHPPGLYVLHKTSIGLCEKSNWLTNTILATRPRSEYESFNSLFKDAEEPRKTTGKTAEPLSLPQQAALWLAILLTQFAAVLTIVPIYALVRLQFNKLVSWVTASLWLFVPAMGVFLPKSDAFYPMIGMTFLAFWVYALKKRSRILATCAGCVFWLGMTFSLALLPVALLGVLLTIKELLPSEEKKDSANSSSQKKLFETIGIGLGSFFALCLLVWAIWDLNLWNVWRWNYRNHAGFYVSNQRTFIWWLFANIGELSFGTGLPVFLAAVGGIFLVWKKKNTLDTKIFSPVICTFLVWGLLWISGKNMGEAARLWLVLMPWFVWSSAEFCERVLESSPDDARWWNSPLFFLLLAQILCCMATVSRVNGFPI